MAISILRALLQLVTPNASPFLTNTNVISAKNDSYIFSFKILLGNLNASLKVTYHIQVPLLCVILNMERKTRVPHATTKH